MKGQQQPQQKQLQVELDKDAAEGTYSNLTLIAHSPAEIILDFARMMPGMQKAKISSRIIMTPSSAKMFLKSLTENIKKYEEKFGEIKIHGTQPAAAAQHPIGFGMGTGEETEGDKK